MAYGNVHSKRRQQAASFGPPILPEGKKVKAAEKKGPDAKEVIEQGAKLAENAPAIASSAKAGLAAGSKLAPMLAGVPVVGPSLAAAAPAAGALVAGGATAIAGKKAAKGAAQMPEKLKDLRSAAAAAYPKMFG